MRRLHKALVVLSVALLASSLGFETAMAATNANADPAIQLLTRVGLGIGMGALISVTTVLAEPNNSANRRKLAYSMIIAVFSAFMVVDGFKEAITYENILSLVLQIAGGAFFTNKGIQMALRVKASASTKKGP